MPGFPDSARHLVMKTGRKGGWRSHGGRAHKANEELTERHLSCGGKGRWSTQLQPLLICRYSNLDLKTQEAYEMAVRGLIRPMNKSPMLITGIRCLHFAPPEFLLGRLAKEVGAVRWGPWVLESLRNALAEVTVVWLS